MGTLTELQRGHCAGLVLGSAHPLGLRVQPDVSICPTQTDQEPHEGFPSPELQGVLGAAEQRAGPTEATCSGVQPQAVPRALLICPLQSTHRKITKQRLFPCLCYTWFSSYYPAPAETAAGKPKASASAKHHRKLTENHKGSTTRSEGLCFHTAEGAYKPPCT